MNVAMSENVKIAWPRIGASHAAACALCSQSRIGNAAFLRANWPAQEPAKTNHIL